MNALQHAADIGGASSVRALVAAGASIDARSDVVTQGHGHPRDRGPVALAIAARAGNEETTSELLGLGAEVDATSDVGITPLLAAVFADAPPALVASLLDAGADPTVTIGCEEGCAVGPAPLDAIGWARALEREELLPLLTAAG